MPWSVVLNVGHDNIGLVVACFLAYVDVSFLCFCMPENLLHDVACTTTISQVVVRGACPSFSFGLCYFFIYFHDGISTTTASKVFGREPACLGLV